ncbi:hypothetical protein F3Y22_tig00116983pilonHSYRG00087 [Hibiscus syriacus]|uniref:Reverse transcriptase zinc-binding domain-containing protein n=1 Tax=Hibiscus syriacus TaxID=106335 RepID=A0A6A2X6T8_HIBSY|nr:hypothetical protein F3Y22_tig00116983pilonHSYRG00087 [Hibiscus syriacus]
MLQSWIWPDILSTYTETSEEVSLKELFQIQVGDGSNINFWHDSWLGNRPLKVLFPRIFALAINKDGPIADFEVKNASGWDWKVVLRKEVFDWEMCQWEELNWTINSLSMLSILKEGFLCKMSSARFLQNLSSIFFSPMRLFDSLPPSFCYKLVWSILTFIVACRLKAKFPSFSLSTDNVVADLTLAVDSSFKEKKLLHQAWAPPPKDVLKFNVDGAMRADGGGDEPAKLALGATPVQD